MDGKIDGRIALAVGPNHCLKFSVRVSTWRAIEKHRANLRCSAHLPLQLMDWYFSPANTASCAYRLASTMESDVHCTTDAQPYIHG